MSPSYHPIIYVRGYAMTRSEIDETTADPFCGFNLGSTVYRATPDKDKPAKKFIFESPVIRLHSDFGYSDVFENGLDIMDSGWEGALPRRSIIIYHYYEQASTLLGRGKTPTISDFATGLSHLLKRVQELVQVGPPAQGKDAADYYATPGEFKCHLVAHSMGGLVCRAFLQNQALDPAQMRGTVAKIFTYATPHNGIEMAGLNVPSWLSMDDMNNFNRDNMAKYLDLEGVYALTNRVDWVPEELVNKFFCMVGTNRNDYEVAMGASRTFAGHGSDGLVRIENASVWGHDGSGTPTTPCATAYTYRSHSGYFGIVNSEEAYQNLIRFLFGDLRVDIWCDVSSVSLPEALQDNAHVDALYQFEVLAAPRGKRWYLTRRVAEEDSVACCSHTDLTAAVQNQGGKSIYLSTSCLGSTWKVDPSNDTLTYSLVFAVRTPDYEVNRAFWFDGHYEGSKLYNGELMVAITPPKAETGWNVRYSWAGGQQTMQQAEIAVDEQGRTFVAIPFANDQKPGIAGSLRFVVTSLN